VQRIRGVGPLGEKAVKALCRRAAQPARRT
jgi:hypothetical protein